MGFHDACYTAPPSGSRAARKRKRGPRSMQSMLRCGHHTTHSPPGGGSGESKPLVPAISDIHVDILSVNIRSFVRHTVELQFHVDKVRPHIVALCETWLDASVPAPVLCGYQAVVRRDRNDGRMGGGVLIFARNDCAFILPVSASDTAERVWCYLHIDIGRMLLGLWYRPPDASAEHMASLGDEVELHGRNCVGTVILGDLNVHNAAWLRFSSGLNTAGRLLQQWSSDHGFSQMVRAPTRGPNLLDLFSLTCVTASLHMCIHTLRITACACSC